MLGVNADGMSPMRVSLVACFLTEIGVVVAGVCTTVIVLATQNNKLRVALRFDFVVAVLGALAAIYVDERELARLL